MHKRPIGSPHATDRTILNWYISTKVFHQGKMHYTGDQICSLWFSGVDPRKFTLKRWRNKIADNHHLEFTKRRWPASTTAPSVVDGVTLSTMWRNIAVGSVHHCSYTKRTPARFGCKARMGWIGSVRALPDSFADTWHWHAFSKWGLPIQKYLIN